VSCVKKSLKNNGFLIIVDVPREFEDGEKTVINIISNQVGPLVYENEWPKTF
jgi:hypothetical protein